MVANNPPPRNLLKIRRLAAGGANNEGVTLYKDSPGYLYVRKQIKHRAYTGGEYDREVQIAHALKNHGRINKIQWWIGESQGSPAEIWFLYCDLGTVESFSRRAQDLGRPGLPQGFCFKVMRDVCEALIWMHYGTEWRPNTHSHRAREWRPIAHNDVHYGNIFLTSQSSSPYYPKAVLGDFGRARLISSPDCVKNDVRSIGDKMAVLAGEPFQTGGRHCLEFRPNYINHLRNSGVSDAYLDVIKYSRYDARNMWEVMDKLVRRQTLHYSHYPPRPLPSEFIPSATERQPYDLDSWGRRPARRPSVHSTNYRTELRAPRIETRAPRTELRAPRY